MSKNIIWTPLPKQALMLSRGEDEAFYGGAAGGGKSDYLVIEALRQAHIPNYKGIILRKTFKGQEELMQKTDSVYPKVFPGAKYRSGTREWIFPSGAKIEFGNLHDARALDKYQGQQYDFIGFDELTQFTKAEYDYLRSRNRAKGSGTKIYMRSTGNPGGIGMGWVKDYFIKNGTEPGKTHWEKIKINDTERGREIIRYLSRTFIPAKVFDNKHLLENNPNYIAQLGSLPEDSRKALLDGNWDIFAGQVFTEWKDDSEGYRTGKYTHVIEPFAIPTHWKIIMSFDYGYSKPFSVGWHALDESGRYYRIREWYGCENPTLRADEGLKIQLSDIAQGILDIEKNDSNIRGRKIYRVADTAIFNKESSGNSIADMFEASPYRIFFERSNKDRLSGKMQFHWRFKFNANGKPMLYIFNTCKNFIRTIPNLIYSLKHPEDIDTTQEDHIYDECRYALMENVITQPAPPPPKIYRPDPLNLHK